jgi:hypothetical protein
MVISALHLAGREISIYDKLVKEAEQSKKEQVQPEAEGKNQVAEAPEEVKDNLESDRQSLRNLNDSDKE